jgi:hypothetical protein
VAHILNINIKDGLNCSTLILSDASQWDPNIPIQNGIIEIKSPLSDCFYPFTFEQGFCSLVVGCSGLGICCPDCFPSEATIPDGNYEIKMSVDPNVKTLVQFNYFRECGLMSTYISTACKVRNLKCDLLAADYRKKLSTLRDIKNLIDEAKWMAEESGDITEALIMYNEALNLLNKFNHRSC